MQVPCRLRSFDTGAGTACPSCTYEIVTHVVQAHRVIIRPKAISRLLRSAVLHKQHCRALAPEFHMRRWTFWRFFVRHAVLNTLGVIRPSGWCVHSIPPPLVLPTRPPRVARPSRFWEPWSRVSRKLSVLLPLCRSRFRVTASSASGCA